MENSLIAISLDLFIALLVVALGSAVLLRQPESRLRTPLLLTHCAVLLFVIGDLGSLLARNISEKQAALAVLYSGTMWIPPSLWLLARRFIEEHDRRPRWSPAWAFRTALVFAALMSVGAVTNPIHGQFLTPMMGARNEHHWLWWVASVGGYGVVISACGLCFWLALRRDVGRTVRQQAAILGTGVLVPVAANLVYNLTPWPWHYDPSVVALASTVACLAVGVYGVGLFGLSPVSLRAALLSDPSAVLLVDRIGRLVFENEAARRLLTEAPFPRSSHALKCLATRLRTAEAGEPVPEAELWGLTQQHAKGRVGTLYQLATLGSEDEHWLWLSAVPVSSRWRANAAYCFRIQDVTRLRESERERARLEERVGRRSKQAPRMPADAFGLAFSSTSASADASADARRNRIPPTNWRSEILQRLDRLGFFSAPDRWSAEDVERVLHEIQSDPALCRDLELMGPEGIWAEFERRLRRD